MTDKKSIIPVELIEKDIYMLRGYKAMLSSDLAKLYKVEPRVLIQTVKRNIERFPSDFMFQLNNQELISLKSQIVISSWGGSRRANPYAFTEQGVAMLSSMLNSKRVIRVNIEIMRAFVRLRQMIASNKELAQKIETPDPSFVFFFQYRETIHQMNMKCWWQRPITGIVSPY